MKPIIWLSAKLQHYILGFGGGLFHTSIIPSLQICTKAIKFEWYQNLGDPTIFINLEFRKITVRVLQPPKTLYWQVRVRVFCKKTKQNIRKGVTKNSGVPNISHSEISVILLVFVTPLKKVGGVTSISLSEIFVTAPYFVTGVTNISDNKL